MLAQRARLTTHAPDDTEHAGADSTKRRPGRFRTRVGSARSLAPGPTKRALAHPRSRPPKPCSFTPRSTTSASGRANQLARRSQGLDPRPPVGHRTPSATTTDPGMRSWPGTVPITSTNALPPPTSLARLPRWRPNEHATVLHPPIVPSMPGRVQQDAPPADASNARALRAITAAAGSGSLKAQALRLLANALVGRHPRARPTLPTTGRLAGHPFSSRVQRAWRVLRQRSPTVRRLPFWLCRLDRCSGPSLTPLRSAHRACPPQQRHGPPATRHRRPSDPARVPARRPRRAANDRRHWPAATGCHGPIVLPAWRLPQCRVG